MATKAKAAEKIEKESPMKLEEAMERLDRVVAALDSEQADLEQSLALYEEGVRLVRICRERLTEAERTVRMLRMSNEGEIEEVEFGAESGREE